ncbi:DNA-directed DNA polymerase II small subunit [Candidatus Methanomassiliicoccus intestinalis]|uniref:DNA-directed DNA polymerase II small subunit n=1 Tax=Candidatus Methanomassiliicoccus intestinalis TaxID=1406512 RepID=UPI0037DDAD87
MRDRVLDDLLNEGILLDPEAAELVLAQADPAAYVRSILAVMTQHPLVLTAEHIKTYAQVKPSRLPPVQVNPVLEELRKSPGVMARPKDSSIEIISDITGNSTCEGSVNDFARCFNDRFKKLKKILSRRPELAGSLPVAKAVKYDREVRTIGMVSEWHNTKNGHKILEIEDEEGRCTVLIHKDSEYLNENIVNDEVIGIVGKATSKGDLLILKDLIRPDIPINNAMVPSDSSSSIAFMSDVHVGSNTFLKDAWGRMMHWLKTEGKDEIQYLVLPGDVVDGIGVFPGQEEELEIEDVFEQYHMLAELLKEVPDSIQILIQPGNHDAVRPAEPQPTFPKIIADIFDSSCMLIGNPCYMKVEGRKILTYHGRSLDDWISSVQGLSYENPIDTMDEMLKRRHLAPLYGGKTPLAPEKEDHLVIEEIPDIFVTGHVHGAGINMYRGVTTICASTWQSQTPFQKMHNFSPDPALLPVVHLGTGKAEMHDFS